MCNYSVIRQRGGICGMYFGLGRGPTEFFFPPLGKEAGKGRRDLWNVSWT